MSKKKSLLGDLDDLFNTAPDYDADPDFGLMEEDRAKLPSGNVGRGNFAGSGGSDSEGGGASDLSDGDDDDDEPELIQKPSKKAKEKGLQLRADINMEDEAYRGKKSSRKAVFEDLNDQGFIPVDSDEGSSGEDDGEDGLDSDQEGSDDDEEDDDEAPDEEAIPNRRMGRKAAARAEDEEDDDDEDEDELDAELAGLTGALGVEADPALEAEFERQAGEEGEAVAAVKESMAKDRRKGKAILEQRALYERSLEARILLQQCLGVAQRLPRPEAHRVLMQEESVKTAYAKVNEGLLETVSMLADLQQALLDRSAAITAAREAAQQAGGPPEDPSTSGRTPGGKKRGRDQVDDVWDRLTDLHRSFAPFRDASIDRWQRKTLLASGRGAMKANLKALNQSVSQQVASLLREGPRAVQRTQMTLDVAPKPLALFEEEEMERKALQSTVAAGEDPARDPETYDDAEFYQTLLKEFIESGSAGSLAGAATLRSTKRRKVVDRRASKGRKIRYQVHEKLVNFMAPVAADHSEKASQLFGNLFGRR